MNGQKVGLNHQHCFGHWSLTNHWELDGIFISHVNKNLVSQPKIYKALNLFDSSTKSRVAALFFSREQVTASSYCSLLYNTLCSCSPVWAAKAVTECSPKSSAIEYAVKTFDCLLE